jgi:hypothetical protein
VTSATPRRILVTGARWSDLLLCLLLACLIVGTSGRLRVYFRVFVAEVSVARVDADGRRHPLPTPEAFRRVGSPTPSPPAALERLVRRIESHASPSGVHTFHASPDASGPDASRPPRAGLPHEPRIVWTIRYSFDSARLDRTRVVAFGGP